MDKLLLGIGIGAILLILNKHNNKLNRIIMKQSEAAAKLRAQATQLAKVRAEVQKLLDVASGDPDISVELQDAIASVETAIKGVDDLNPDEQVESPGEESPAEESPAGDTADGSNDAARR